MSKVVKTVFYSLISCSLALQASALNSTDNEGNNSSFVAPSDSEEYTLAGHYALILLGVVAAASGVIACYIKEYDMTGCYSKKCNSLEGAESEIALTGQYQHTYGITVLEAFD
jgi:Mn2+/Fe2+ NRAMP family transporter